MEKAILCENLQDLETEELGREKYFLESINFYIFHIKIIL